MIPCQEQSSHHFYLTYNKTCHILCDLLEDKWWNHSSLPEIPLHTLDGTLGGDLHKNYQFLCNAVGKHEKQQTKFIKCCCCNTYNITLYNSIAATQASVDANRSLKEEYCSSRFRQTIWRHRKGKQFFTNTVISGDGQLLTSTEDVIRRWKEYWIRRWICMDGRMI